MKLWADTDAINTAGRTVALKVSEMTADINHQAKARGQRQPMHCVMQNWRCLKARGVAGFIKNRIHMGKQPKQLRS